MNRISEKEWLEDFQDFVRSGEGPVPEPLSREIRNRVWRDLNPSGWLVFAKLLGIHAVVGTLSLTICNQFGMSPFHSGFSLSEYFMKFGHSACMFLCGTLFLSLSLALGRAALRPEEVRVLTNHALPDVFALSVLSLGIFLALGAEISLLIGLLWLIGAMLGGTSVAMIPRRGVVRAGAIR